VATGFGAFNRLLFGKGWLVSTADGTWRRHRAASPLVELTVSVTRLAVPAILVVAQIEGQPGEVVA
jgi:hypothetical protein